MPTRRAEIRNEVRRRADHQLRQDHLVVDYYRIRRRVAMPLPVRSIPGLRMPMRMELPPGMDYPWATWLVWALEERIHALGWAGEWFGDAKARAAVAIDLAALAAWPAFRQYEKPDLSLGHSARMLVTAYTRWRWLRPATRTAIAAGLARMIDDGLPLCDRYFGAWTTKEQILALKDPRPAQQNIPLIGTVGLALAARAIGHESTGRLDQRLAIVYGALLDLLARGFTEGVAYDGYILDFIALWLRDAPAEVRDPILRHPRFRQFFEESYRLSAPGRAMQVAELSDVEPVGMPFHASAHAKCLALLPDPLIRWHLDRCDLRELRCDALVDLAESAVKPSARAPAAGATDAHYALVLRSGWEARDLAVAMSCTTSPHHHMHDDNGSIVIGTAGTWLISDPGYQQYLGTSERAFTLGAAAHNAPVIDGAAQTAKACRRTALERCGPGIFRAELDLTACYAPEAKLASVTRTVWLAGRDLVVVADRIAGAQVRSLRYHWHAHADAAWWWEDGAAMIRCAGATAWIRCVGAPLDDRDVDRLRGSRGQLTLSKQLEPAVGAHWWVFSIGTRPHAVERDGAQLRVGSRRFALA